jgi:hypothetical protein
MKHRSMTAGTLLAGCSLVLASCSMTTQGQQQLAGAGLGMLAGAALGAAATGGNPRAIGIGAASGALAGWGTVKIAQLASRRTQSADVENELQGWRPGESARVKMRGVSVQPNPVAPGSRATIAMNYGLTGPRSAAIPVRETIEIRDPRNKVILPPQPVEESRAPGGWESPRALPLPSSAPAGTYQIIARVEAGTSHDESRATLTVQ